MFAFLEVIVKASEGAFKVLSLRKNTQKSHCYCKLRHYQASGKHTSLAAVSS